MTNDELLQDIKQYVGAELSANTLVLKGMIKSEIAASEARIISVMSDGFAAVGDAVDRIDQHLNNHESRITWLEAKT